MNTSEFSVTKMGQQMAAKHGWDQATWDRLLRYDDEMRGKLAGKHSYGARSAVIEREKTRLLREFAVDEAAIRAHNREDFRHCQTHDHQDHEVVTDLLMCWAVLTSLRGVKPTAAMMA